MVKMGVAKIGIRIRIMKVLVMRRLSVYHVNI